MVYGVKVIILLGVFRAIYTFNSYKEYK